MILFVPFKALEGETGELCFSDFEYSYISDIEIRLAMKHANPNELSKPWTPNCDHTLRVAHIVKAMKLNIKFPPVEMEISLYNRNANYVNDGHHRIRALQYLKAKGFHAELGGYIDLMEEFARICIS